MTEHTFTWQCPACNNPLNITGTRWQCENNHSFDQAKEGYVNLLLAQHKKSKMPGDSKEMVLARRAFLDQDHYFPLAQDIAKLIQFHTVCRSTETEPSPVFNIFDAGCGEGYYLQKIICLFKDFRSELKACGIDISKQAIQKASKNNALSFDELQFAVASCFNIPLANKTQDAVIQIFAPSDANEVARVLKDDGIWIRVNPAANHLYELKEMVYRSPQKHKLNDDVPAGFSLLKQKELSFNIKLNDHSMRKSLLMMTPFYWTISADKKQLLLDNLTDASAHFDIKVMQKKTTEIT